MSQNFRTKLKYWFWLVIGIVLISIQVYRYTIDTLEINTKEGIVLLIGLMFMIKPTAIPDLLLKMLNKKQP
jgi:hypothetical protein